MGFHGHGMWGLFSSLDEKPKVTLGLMRRVLGYGKPYRWKLAVMLVLILATTGLSLLTPLIFRAMIDRVIPSGQVNQLFLLGLGLLLIPAVNGGISVIQRRLNAQVGEGVIFDLRAALFSSLQRMSLRFFTHTRVGEMMSRLNNDVIGAQNAISNTIVGMITNLIQVSAVMAVMASLEWCLALVSVLILPLFLLTARRMGRRLRDIARQAMNANAAMNAMANETLNIGGALLIKLFGRAEQEVDRFNQRAGVVRDIGIQRAVVGAVFFVIIGLVSAVGMAVVYGFGGYLVINKVFTVGTIVAFGSYLGTLYGALSALANAPVEFATSVVSFERVFEVIDLQAEIADQPGAAELKNVRGELVFDDVSFRYEAGQVTTLSLVTRYGQMERVTAVLSGGTVAQPAGAKTQEPNGPGERPESVIGEKSRLDGTSETAEEEIVDEVESITHSQARLLALDHVSFVVKPGQLVALVGPSGAGKTTLTYLIPRLYDPTEGSICIDGHDLRTVSLASLSAQVGMVTQENHLFHDTIRTNLLYARLDASQAELEAACRAANIHDFIADLPDGYDTVVGERGYRLSGGEKQRVALARVILKDPRLLVLDEATSHLDSESEALIQEALKRVMAGRTSIVIAHRLSTILAADLILVMDRGQVVEQGNHAELLDLGGLYAGLYHTQFSRERV